ncbi:MAG: endonuclease/exonuclease/phosphatase family protein [Actinomycetota bacterium]|nr:endonuclease/exonuclease/phosphatase family protein [Actinomycetota bacterium]
MALVVRTWNLFHGRTKPPSGRAHLDRMVSLVSRGADLVALQEVPVWALARLEAWSAMTSVGAVARPPRLARLGLPLTRLAPDALRSALTGQANALLLAASLRPVGRQRIVELHPRSLRERRVCQLLRIAHGARTVLVANLHATAHAPGIARRELALVADLVAGDEPAIVCGDFNARRTGIPGFSDPIDGIDQVLVRGLELERPPAPWEEERRRFRGRLLSDHAPVEAVVK